MSAWEDGLRFCAELRSATADFTVRTFQQLVQRYRFNMDKLPVAPEPTDDLTSLGGYAPELLTFVRSVGPRTLNSSCFFGPHIMLSELLDDDYFQTVIATNLKVTRDDVRFIGGDHGEGRWILLTRSGRIFFMEVDDDYRRVPEPCFTDFIGWFRVNLILGLLESRLQRQGLDVFAGVPLGFANRLLTEFSAIDALLTAHTWPYELFYRLESAP